MKVYICSECGNVMDEVEATRFYPQVHDELPEKAVEMISELRCIYCDSEDIEEAEICSLCGIYYPVSELSIYGVCSKCRVDAVTKGMDSVKLLQDFAVEQMDAFAEFVEERRTTEDKRTAKKKMP